VSLNRNSTTAIAPSHVRTTLLVTIFTPERPLSTIGAIHIQHGLIAMHRAHQDSVPGAAISTPSPIEYETPEDNDLDYLLIHRPKARKKDLILMTR